MNSKTEFEKLKEILKDDKKVDELLEKFSKELNDCQNKKEQDMKGHLEILHKLYELGKEGKLESLVLAAICKEEIDFNPVCVWGDSVNISHLLMLLQANILKDL